MKIAVWMYATEEEREYVAAEPSRKRGPFVANPYEDVDEEEEEYGEIAQTIDEALYQYYTIENNLPVPNWRTIKDPEWWIQYLKDMGLDPSNP